MITIPEGARAHRIDRRIYGQFAEHLGRCIYEGLWVGEESAIANHNGIRSDVVAALRAIQVPIVRWPGGCFADEYHFAEMRDWVEYITLDGSSPMADLRKRHGRQQPWRLPYFGVGNESWGCGGNMLPLYYANQYRQYQTYVRQFGEFPIYKIACGANDDDYEWTEVLMATSGAHMDGLSLHYYTIPTGNWDAKGSAVEFGEHEWYETIRRTRKMATLLERHSAIMDKHDLAKRVGLIIDEWGTWYDPTPGTNPGFLHQQNTMRDAVVAALNFNLFHRHADRVRMANIAQMVNVLQAMVLTDGPRMIKTPTYWAFDLYTDHHDAWFVDARPAPGDAPGVVGRHGEYTVSWKDGAYTVTVTNVDLDAELALNLELPKRIDTVHRARSLAGESPRSHNTFAAPDTVAPTDFDGYRVDGARLHLAVPPRSIVTVRVE